MNLFYVWGAVNFALLFILVGYFIGNYEGKKVYRELLCYRQARIMELQQRVDALVPKVRHPADSSRAAKYPDVQGATVAELTRWMQQAVTVKEYNYYVRMIRSIGSELMRTPRRREHVHADYKCKQ